MKEFRLVQVSDPHLSRSRAYFQRNWDKFVAMMSADPPDLIVCSGDLCFDGVNFPEDLAFAREQLDRLPSPWLAIPGNHDIGDQPPDKKFGKPVDDEKRARWLKDVGPDYWHRDHDAWRFVGIDAMLLDSGLAIENQQWNWLEDILARRDGRQIALFLHKPLFLTDRNETVDTNLSLGVRARGRLLDLARQHQISLFASGHLHRTVESKDAGMTFVWAPSVGFILTGYPKGLDIGIAKPGFVEYRFSGSKFSSRLELSEQLALNDMTGVMEQHKSTVYLPAFPLEENGATRPSHPASGAPSSTSV